jgi:hypothetical protein
MEMGGTGRAVNISRPGRSFMPSFAVLFPFLVWGAGEPAAVRPAGKNGHASASRTSPALVSHEDGFRARISITDVRINLGSLEHRFFILVTNMYVPPRPSAPLGSDLSKLNIKPTEAKMGPDSSLDSALSTSETGVVTDSAAGHASRGGLSRPLWTKAEAWDSAGAAPKTGPDRTP